ncbi:hypothetical protein HC766_05600, partial [Candidatus Gracilibacteria bacterium]|nr:hypothetical protein [Candidatus Gracilibacteria bacterium]
MNTKFDSILHLKKFVQQNWSTNRKKTKVTLGYLSKIDNSSETIIFISEYYFQLQYYKDAINIANRGLQIKTSAELYMRFSILIGRCYEAMKKYSTAEAFYDKVIILRLSFVRKFKNLTYRMCKNIIIAYFLKARILLKVSFGIDVDKVDVKTVFCTPT